MNKKVLVSVLLSLISFVACQTCDQRVLDVVLIVDSSASIGLSNFTLAKSAVVEMINQLNTIGPQKIRVGVINYSSTVQTISSFIDTDQDKSRIIGNVNYIMPYLGGMRATGDALARARQIFFDYPRKDIPRVVVLFTDGASNAGANVITEADLLKNQGVAILTVGIGSQINHAELNAISTIPLYTYKKLIASYKDLAIDRYAAINEITKTVCKTPAFIMPRQKVLAQKLFVEKNELRYYEVDITSKAPGDIILIELNSITGICSVEGVSWFTSSKTQPIVSSNVSNDVPQESKNIFHTYVEVPPNALRLYVNVKCIYSPSSYELIIKVITHGMLIGQDDF
jgi:hypothetical protein